MVIVAAAYIMRRSVRSKKMAVFASASPLSLNWTI
jgi:hypothetical protein